MIIPSITFNRLVKCVPGAFVQEGDSRPELQAKIMFGTEIPHPLDSLRQQAVTDARRTSWIRHMGYGLDALAYLRAQPAGSLGGLLAAQVVEHVDPGYLTNLLDAAWVALRPGSVAVIETINPACWFAFFESYIRDITHVRPLHPETLKYLLVASGFEHVEIRFRSPYPEHEKLQRVAGAALGDAADVLNANAEKVNRLLFTHLDYAAVARRA